MRRFQRSPTPLVYTSISISTVFVFILDCYTPIGLSVWALYLAPVVLSYLTWHPLSSIVTAATATLLTTLGFVLSPTGADPTLAQINRTIGLATIWILAVFGHQFIGNKLTVRKQEWLQSGRTSLSETMVGEQDLNRLGENVLRHLVGYLEAQAGVLFIEDGTGFRRIAAHGVAEGARMPERFEGGDGLLGQAIKNRRACILHDLPDEYFTIGSGLGRSAPRHLLIAPLAVDGEVNTVLELGFFSRIGTADTELIDRVSESIAVAVRSAQSRTQLQALLQETQRQAEELQVQSEELRVNNEELEEQSRR